MIIHFLSTVLFSYNISLYLQYPETTFRGIKVRARLSHRSEFSVFCGERKTREPEKAPDTPLIPLN